MTRQDNTMAGSFKNNVHFFENIHNPHMKVCVALKSGHNSVEAGHEDQNNDIAMQPGIGNVSKRDLIEKYILLLLVIRKNNPPLDYV